MVACLACHAQNPAANKFCGECGARLSVGWPPCDHPNPPSQKFCGQCGAAREPTGQAPLVYTPKHLAEKILRSRAAIEGERKLVSVMFTDVSGFTAMSERLDPEEVHAIMDRAF
ncbi:MAG TPA: zinc ribbon domain-containing protein, partial [Methylomirabilota bacterium]|nr:zinc ribbon domain-containing protein [Methylomirabilota bacterium]